MMINLWSGYFKYGSLLKFEETHHQQKNIYCVKFYKLITYNIYIFVFFVTTFLIYISFYKWICFKTNNTLKRIMFPKMYISGARMSKPGLRLWWCRYHNELHVGYIGPTKDGVTMANISLQNYFKGIPPWQLCVLVSQETRIIHVKSKHTRWRSPTSRCDLALFSSF